MRRSRARPDPVSCESCRTKKLRCNRVQPCSNCASRGINCKFLVVPQRPEADTGAPFHDRAELLKRIERLESLLLLKDESENAKAAKALESPQDSTDGNAPDIHQQRDKDLNTLENMGSRGESMLAPAPATLAIHLRKPREILADQAGLQSPDTMLSRDEHGRVIVTLPDYSAAALLLDKYEAVVHYTCHIVHLPTIRALMKSCYLQINHNKRPGPVALLLAIFATSAFFQEPSPTSEIATTEDEAVELAKFWSKQALHLLDHPHRIAATTIEDVQACILMSCMLQHLDGLSRKGRFLIIMAISLARDLRLHRLDVDSESTEKETNLRTLIDLEVKRRAFWQLASVDWLQSVVSGPQEGIYFLHPRHISVKLPRDCADDEIGLDDNDQAMTGPRPTSMAFFHAKVRLAHLCREMTDAIPLETKNLIQMPYENIIGMDKRFLEYLSTLPYFIRLDPESRERSKDLEVIYPHLPILRYYINAMTHSRRCRLHQRFLLRQSSDPRYAYSRRICLESARAVVHGFDDARTKYAILNRSVARLGMPVHLTYLALTVMVMDLCFNKGAEGAEEVKAEVRAGLHTLMESRDISHHVERALGSLFEILQKHNVSLPDLSTSSQQNNGYGYELNHDALRAPEAGHLQFAYQGLDYTGTGMAFDLSLDGFLQLGSQNGPDFDEATWDNLFSALDSKY